jgi:hypothetical protein
MFRVELSKYAGFASHKSSIAAPAAGAAGGDVAVGVGGGRASRPSVGLGLVFEDRRLDACERRRRLAGAVVG